MTAIGIATPRVDAQPHNRIAIMRANFIRQRDRSAEQAARAEYAILRDGFLARVDHYNRLIAMTEGRT